MRLLKNEISAATLLIAEKNNAIFTSITRSICRNVLSIPTNSLKSLWLSGKGARKQVKLLSGLYILIHTIQYGLIFDNNCRVNYLCLSM